MFFITLELDHSVQQTLVSCPDSTCKERVRLPYLMLHCYHIMLLLRDSSEREGALSRSNNDIVDSEDVDSVSLGILPDL